MATYLVDTTRGKMAFVAEMRRPDVFLIHGFKRSPAHVWAWRERIPNLGLIALPGHGPGPQLGEVSVEVWIDAWRQAFEVMEQCPLLIGESLGAILAMGLPARAVVAVEPLLSVDQLWPQKEVIRAARARGVVIHPEEEALFETSYDWVLDRISVPTLIIGGDIPLMPIRFTQVAPSLLSEADFARYAAHPLVEAHRIAGGHTLLDENPDGVMALAGPFLARHAGAAQTP